MANLKIEFQKPKLTLYNTNYTPLGTLTNKTHMSAHNVTLTSRVNETPYLSFDIQLGGLIDNNSTELLVKHKNDYFVIKNISMTSGDTNSATVKAEHIACELKGIMVSHFEDLTDVSPRNMWETIRTNCSMSKTIENRYIFETNIVDTYRCLSGEGEKSVYEHLLNIAEQFESCLLFSTDDDGIIHIKLLYGDINRGKFIRKGKDLKQLNLNFSTDSLFTKIIPFGATNDDGEELTIKGVNNGKPYITNYDYYLAKGMTGEEILNNPLCNQEYIYRNTDITDARDLLRLGKEELDKLSKPTLDGTIETIDLNVLEGSLYLSPILCEKIIVVDKDINYSISCKITEIEFMYDNPLESKIGISNVVRYGSTLRNLVRNSEVIGQVLTSGSNGKPNLNTSRIKSGTISSYDSSTWINLDNGDFNFKDKIKSVNNEFIIDLNDIGLSDAFVTQYQKDKEDINNRIEGANREINSINGQLENIVHLTENTVTSVIETINNYKSGTILIPDGEYVVDNITFDGLKNIVIKGNNNTIIKNPKDSRVFGLIFKNCDNVTFENLIFDGNNTITELTQYGNNMIVYGENSTNLTIQNCRFYNCTDVAIQDKTQPISTPDVNDTKIANTKIINNHFENCKMTYITKPGGARNVIYSNNTHYNCMLGFKLDGEAYDLNTTPKQYKYYSTKCGNVVVSGNTFNNCGNWSSLNNTNSHCVMIEEHTESVIVSNNVFNKLSYVGAIGVNTGQGCQVVDNVNIIGNIIDDVKESYAITLGHGNIDNTTQGNLGTVKIHSNIFRNIERSAIVSLLQFRYIVDLDIKNNTFESCGNKESDLVDSLHYECIKINGGAKIVTVDGNTFKPSATSNKKICFAVVNHKSFNKYYVRNNNFFGTVSDGSVYADRLIYLQKVRNIIFENNNFKNTEIRLEETQVTFINNYLDGSNIQTYKTNGVDCDVRCFKNIALKNIDVDYYLRIADDYKFHKSINDIVDSRYTTTKGILIPSPFTGVVEDIL